MARSKHSKKSGASFAGIPRVVMECPDYINLSANAIRLLNEMAYQFKGINNGDLCPSWTLMKERGFASKATLRKALTALVSARFLILTRQGGKNLASLYALSWAPINECPKKRLEIGPTKAPARNFHLERNQGWPKLDSLVQKLGKLGTETGLVGSLKKAS